MSKDKYKEEEKRITAELMEKSKETVIGLYLQAKWERDYLQAEKDRAEAKWQMLRKKLSNYYMTARKNNKYIMTQMQREIVMEIYKTMDELDQL